MEWIKPPIKFYQRRNFSEKMSVSFEFLKDNAKLLFKLCAYFILPVVILQAIFFNSYVGTIYGMMGMAGQGLSPTGIPTAFLGGILVNAIFIMIFSLIGSAVLSSIVYTCIQEYNIRKSLKGVDLAELKPGLIRNFKRAIIISLIVMGLIIVAYLVLGLLAAITPFTLIATIPALFVFALPLSMIIPVYIFENSSIDKAIDKAYKLGLKTWGPLFGILFVMGLLANLVQGVAAVPWSIIYVVRMVLTASGTADPDISGSFLFSFAQYITTVIMLFFAYAASSIVLIGLAYHYSSASEASEGTSVNEDIEKFESL